LVTESCGTFSHRVTDLEARAAPELLVQPAQQRELAVLGEGEVARAVDERAVQKEHRRSPRAGRNSVRQPAVGERMASLTGATDIVATACAVGGLRTWRGALRPRVWHRRRHPWNYPARALTRTPAAGPAGLRARRRRLRCRRRP